MDELKEHENFIQVSLKKPLNECKKLNLGCGYDYREGWVNADLNEQAKVDVVVDLNKLPLPFKSNTFDYIFSAHTIEHVREDMALPLMVELWRILKPRGIVELRMPHFSHYSALSGFAHKRAFSFNSFGLFYDKDPLANVPKAPRFKEPLYTVLRQRLKHQRTDNGRRMLVPKSFYFYIAEMVNKLANNNPNLCEKIWCYWVGGFQEMQIILRKVGQDVKFPRGYCNTMNK